MAERVIENMRIWQEARSFTNDIYKMMSSCKDYGFRDQIQRATVSIMNNIAEGFESGSDAKFLNFLNIFFSIKEPIPQQAKLQQHKKRFR